MAFALSASLINQLMEIMQMTRPPDDVTLLVDHASQVVADDHARWH